MLRFCQDQASSGISGLAEEIVATRDTEAMLNVDTLDIYAIVGDLKISEVFVLWDALGRPANCVSLGQLLARVEPPTTNVSLFIKRLRAKMTLLHATSKVFARDMQNAKKKDSITSRLCAVLCCLASALQNRMWSRRNRMTYAPYLQLIIV